MNFPNIDPIIFQIGIFSISYYSLSYIIGILLGIYYIDNIIKQFLINITIKNLENFLTFAVIGIIIGGRLGYVLIYDPIKYFSDPINILKTYEGGMSFHGGIIGIAVSTFIYSKIYKISFYLMIDLISTAAPIGLFLGRIANFINGELYGRQTDSIFGMKFPNGGDIFRHPSQIYESLTEGLILFITLYILTFHYKTIKIEKFNTSIFLILYAILRSFIELFREPDIQIGYIAGYLTMGQILSLIMLIIGIYLINNTRKYDN